MLIRELAGPVPAAAPAGELAARTVIVRLCSWNDPRPVVDPDGEMYREQYRPGSIELAENVHVVDTHSGQLIGRAVPGSLVDDGDGPTVELVIARTGAGNDLGALLDAGVIRAVSMELEPLADTRAGDLVTRTAVRVQGIAFAFRPQLAAPVLAVRERPNPMTDTAIIRETAELELEPVAAHYVDTATLDRALDDVRRELVTRDAPAPGHPLARFRSLDEWADASWSDPATARLLHRALADQVTANNPGVIPPAWLSEVLGIVDHGRPLVTAFGVRPLPPAGMEVDWPYFDGDLSALVGEQLTQKAPITSVRVDLKRGVAPLRTWAGGSDLSYQLIRRSSPSYRDAYMRIMFAAYALVTEAAAAAAAVAVAGATPLTLDLTGTNPGKAAASALFEGSTLIKAATGAPASFAAAATDVFVALGGELIPAPYGTSNVPGTATASTLTVNVSGLNVTHAPELPAGKMIESNGSAGAWFEDGPFSVAAEDVEKLGQNVAVWGMGNFAPTAPAGVVVITCTLPAPVRSSSKSK